MALLVYANTLLGDFTFDDNFAVITNKDVTDAAIPVRDLFKHDFWGQDITSSQSHKSYRPLTILAFRLTHSTWCLLIAAVPGLSKLAAVLPINQPVHDETRVAWPASLHPLPFHVLAILAHAVASIAVFGLCQHLFAVLEDSSSSVAADTINVPADSMRQQQQQSKASGKGFLQQLLMWEQQPQWWRVPSSAKFRAQALLAGLMFALHPIHTEAVAGIVGCAELLCVALSFPALLCFFMAVDSRHAAGQQLQALQAAADSSGRISRVQASKQHSSGRGLKQQQQQQQNAAGAEPLRTLLLADAVQHWCLVGTAVVLAFCAALTKEIGITVIGTMLLYDMLLAPNIRQPALAVGSGSRQGVEQQQLQPAAARRKLLRMVLVAATAVVYVKVRSWVAVQQLVDIYRKVENPIPFAESRLTRVLSTGYLHARYFWLLVMPLHLSADWSFSCIPLVEACTDVRNLATLALYCYLLHTALAAQPLSLLRQLWGLARLAAGAEPPHQHTQAASVAAAANGTPAAAQPVEGGAVGKAVPGSGPAAASCARSRWRLMVLAGLVVAPFFPASNVLFYVGTFIGERLLYSPSIGFCLLAAELLGAAFPDSWQSQPGSKQQSDKHKAQQQEQKQAAATAAEAQPAGKQQSATQPAEQTRTRPHVSAPPSLCSWCVLLLCGVLLGGYGCRTLLRNQDWWDEEQLFLSALGVCPGSAKVQQNNGVLQRRLKNYTAAMEHFKLAQAIEPGYCEPTYWVGLTAMNMGNTSAGLATLKASLSCRYTAAEALQALNKVYVMMMEAVGGTDPRPMVEWASLLASPHVLRVADACATAEDAALGAALAGKGAPFVTQAVGVCLKGLHEWQHGDTQPDTLAALAKQRSDINITMLSQCVNMRLPVYKAMAGSAVASQPVRLAIYKYLAQVSGHYPACRSLEGGGPMPVDDSSPAGPVPTTHQKLLHKVQAADPEDPWLQLEWGAALLALGGDPASNLRDAAMHLEVAAAMFAKASQDLLGASSSGAGGGGEQGRKLLHLTELDGTTPLSPMRALEAAMRPLVVFRDAAQAAGGKGVAVAQLCETLQRLCHLRLQTVALLQQQEQQGGGGVGDAAKAAAIGAVRQCMDDIGGRPACAAQAVQLRRMVRWQ